MLTTPGGWTYHLMSAALVWGLFMVGRSAAEEQAPKCIFDGKPKLLVVNGYSTSFQWPAVLQRKLDRYAGGRSPIRVESATAGGTPIARWMDVATGQPRPVWTERLTPKLRAKGDATAIVLAQQSLQWAFGERTEGIRGKDDTERIEQGADVLEKYARRLQQDGADLVLIAMHVYKHPMEPEIGNERLALTALVKRDVPGVLPGPDVWVPTKEVYPQGFAGDGVHPGPIGVEVMAQKWFETLLAHDGLEVPAWSTQEMADAVAGKLPPSDPVRRAPSQRRRPAPPSPPSDLPENVKRRIYKQTPQGDLAIYLHFPPDWKPDDKRPAIVFFFGGGWRSGTTEQFTPQATYFAQRGLVTARADYRVKGRHGTTPEKCVEDGKSAVRWLREHAAQLGIDPERIVASGGSAGGHVAAATATTEGLEAEGEDLAISSKPNLLVLFNPVLNTTRLAERIGSEEIALQISPNHHLDKEVPPAIIFFGTHDGLIAGANEYLPKAEKLGLTAELWTAEGQGHGFFNRPPWLQCTMELTDWFLARYTYTQGEPTIDVPEGSSMKKERTR